MDGVDGAVGATFVVSDVGPVVCGCLAGAASDAVEARTTHKDRGSDRQDAKSPEILGRAVRLARATKILVDCAQYFRARRNRPPVMS